MVEQKKIARPTDEEYKHASWRLRLSYAPRTYACMKCGWPVIDGYCCNTCGDDNPSEPADVPDAKLSDGKPSAPRSQKLAAAGFTRRPTWRALPPDDDAGEPQA